MSADTPISLESVLDEVFRKSFVEDQGHPQIQPLLHDLLVLLRSTPAALALFERLAELRLLEGYSLSGLDRRPEGQIDLETICVVAHFLKPQRLRELVDRLATSMGDEDPFNPSSVAIVRDAFGDHWQDGEYFEDLRRMLGVSER